ncbi:hypothetical protein D3C78_1846680 [compost metagenome]
MKTAPVSAVTGSKMPWRTPTKMRAAWGMTSPTKPMEPTSDTIAAVMIAETEISTA